MQQIANNAPEQALRGDFPTAIDDAVMASGDAHQNQLVQYLNSRQLAAGFQRVVFDLLVAGMKQRQRASDAPPSSRG